MMDQDQEQETRWTEDRILTAIADVEDRSMRSSRMLSKRLDRLERSRHSEFSELGDQVMSLATGLLMAYGVYLLVRAIVACVQPQQQQ